MIDLVDQSYLRTVSAAVSSGVFCAVNARMSSACVRAASRPGSRFWSSTGRMDAAMVPNSGADCAWTVSRGASASSGNGRRVSAAPGPPFLQEQGNVHQAERSRG